MRLSGESANFEVETGQVGYTIGNVVPFVISNTVNMRTLLGDMYDKYNKFYIIFNSFGGFTSTNTTYQSGVASAGQNALVWTLGMYGDLRFLSNTVNGQLSSVGYFPMRFTLPVNGYGFLNGPISNGIVFEKPLNDTATISISPYLIRGGTQATISTSSGTGTGLYDFNFSFTIYGLSE